MRKKELIELISTFCPLDTQEEWDNSGIQIEIGEPDVKKLLLALDITDEVIDEAMDLGANVIITHHPLIFGGVCSIEANDVTGRYIQRLIRAGISVYSYHTPFDKMEGGLNDGFGKVLGLEAESSPNNGYVRYSELKEDRFFGDLIKEFSEKLGIDVRLFRAVGDPETKIKRLGWCTGSGAEFFDDAMELGLDMFITGDVKYHDAVKAKAMGLTVLDVGHYGSERIFTDIMYDILKDKTDLEIVRSGIDINPFSW